MPMPRPEPGAAARFAFQPVLLATSSRHSANAQVPTAATSGIVSPVRIAFTRRRSIGSMPSASAAMFICDSVAKSACGAPSPRIAPAGALFV